MTSVNRKIIEELDSLTRRAQSIALHNLDELNLDPHLPVYDKALFCFLIALEEKKRSEND